MAERQIIVPEAFAPASLANPDGPVALLRKGHLSFADHINAVMDRIDRLEPAILALLPEPGRRERLLAEAAALAARWPDSATRPPLYGALLGIKDIFAADGFETRAGSRLPADLFRMPEGPVIRALRQAGALVLGKTVTTEFAYFSPGPTRNPWDGSHTPGGSSSGSAAAVAAGFCHIASGTQTIGSITRPAAYCGVVGWKPSHERTSRDGVLPFSVSVDHIGLFTADVASLATCAALVANDWRHQEHARQLARFAAPTNSSAARPLRRHTGTGPALSTQPTLSDPPPQPTLTTLPAQPPVQTLPVLAIPEGPYLEQADAPGLAAFRDLVEWLDEAGFRIKTVPAFRDIEDINARHRRICAADLERVHHGWFATYAHLYAPTTADLIRTGATINDARLTEDRLGRQALRVELEQLLDDHQADCWIAPAAPGPAPAGLSATGSPIMNLPWTHAGLPTLALPAGVSTDGLPLGLQLAGRFNQDEALLAVAACLEAWLA
jgi:Asp-tRNA(Asn)/Glu-tRNA(Gln) amidotransferase A subunit family amidase